MNINSGNLWFNNDPKMNLLQKVQNAAADFKKKFGYAAEYCLVNVNDAQDQNLEEIEKKCNLIVQPYKYVPHHIFWVGCEQTLVSGEA